MNIKKMARLVCLTLLLIIPLSMLTPLQVHATTNRRITSISTGKATTVIVNSVEQSDSKIIDEVPLMNQNDYPNDWYGYSGTVATHGCGITSVAMIASYLTDTFYSPAILAKQFGKYNGSGGSAWELFEDSARTFGIPIPICTTDWDEVGNALENGHIVISLQNSGMFTTGAHYIVLTGVNKDGKITVNDPFGTNWNASEILKNGFTNGFTDEQIKIGGWTYWIYPTKEAVVLENGAKAID